MDPRNARYASSRTDPALRRATRQLGPSEQGDMSNRLSSVFPRPAASDADDVVWTLQTAAVQWQRGLRADAIVWVRKAADTATYLGHGVRAEELRSHAAR